ncbi:hypothetical protein PV10_02274 [Exophiala mesophila]|uniref:Inner kinetochore subunit AME1 domain-containing protein n=1 Tax=Exophiala mesophila TaxID=212818 RepID=A0A0D2A6F0_EXOME|nr:uncharacterized protein PV10_02274 [Exophiala mesophila]KIV94513.1 hypothetical protein PV10_02274 [Exophiala mesophila]
MSSATQPDRSLRRQSANSSQHAGHGQVARTIDMGNDRQQRQQMRQRGAASRKVDHVDFGFAFPSSARSQRSTKQTPQQRRSNSRQPSATPSIRTPSVRTGQAPTTSNVRETRRSSNQSRATSQTPQMTEGRSAKRRRLSNSHAFKTPISVQTNPVVVEIPSQTRSTRSSAKRASQIFTIAEDANSDDQSNPPTTDGLNGIEKTEKENEPLVSHEAEEPASDRPLSSPKAAPQQEGQALAEDTSFHPDIENNEPTLEEDSEADEYVDDSRDVIRETTIDQSLIESSTLDSSSIAPSKPKKRKKRKLVVLGRKKKRVSDQSQVEESTLEEPTIGNETEDTALPDNSTTTLEADEAVEADNADVADRIDDGETTPNRHGIAAKLLDRTPNGADEEDEDETYVQESSPEPTTPAAAVKKPRSKNPRLSKENDRLSQQEKSKPKSSKSTFPILTHRMTNLGTLPTISEEVENGNATTNEAETESQAPRIQSRSQPNLVDVLAQICRETISNLIEDLDKTTTSTTKSDRATCKNKRSALQAFGQDLDDELFQLSEAVENRINLEARVRKAKREKSSLQAEYMEIRKQREQIALKCDAVRRQHWECEQDAREKWQLSQAARRVELELEREQETLEEGSDDADEGVEYLLHTVAGNVSALSDEGGMLDKIRSFNSQLENLARLLESR